MKPSEKTIQALEIIRDNPKIDARSFAEEMWPESHMHTRHSNGGNGCQVGKAAWLCAGSYLGRLKKAGLIKGAFFDGWGHRLTEDGIQILQGEKQ